MAIKREGRQRQARLAAVPRGQHAARWCVGRSAWAGCDTIVGLACTYLCATATNTCTGLRDMVAWPCFACPPYLPMPAAAGVDGVPGGHGRQDQQAKGSTVDTVDYSSDAILYIMTHARNINLPAQLTMLIWIVFAKSLG
jgi:hypothetical protein